LPYHNPTRKGEHVELRTYGKILWRRIWIVALVVGVAVIYVGYQYYTAYKSPDGNKIYHTSVDIRIGLQAFPHGNNPTFTDYITTSEALADEFATGPTLTSTAFAKQVIQQIQHDMPTIMAHYRGRELGDWKNASAILGALTATRTHSVVAIDVRWPTEAGAWAIAHAVGEVSAAHMPEYLDYQISNKSANGADYPVPTARVINKAENISTVTASRTTQTSLLLLLLVVSLILGIALAFLVEYLDDRIYDSTEVTQMLQLPIYGEIPHAPTSNHSQAKRSPASQ
jgi:capsular polysaccharide biosynthesis protein